MTMDFAMKRIRIGSSSWQEATIGRQGEYLLSLTMEHDLMQYDPDQPDFALKTAEPDLPQVDGFTLHDFEQEEQGFTVSERAEVVDDNATKCLRRHDLNTMDVQLRTHLDPVSTD